MANFFSNVLLKTIRFITLSGVIIFLSILAVNFLTLLIHADQLAIVQDSDANIEFSYFIDQSSSLTSNDVLSTQYKFIKSPAQSIPFALGTDTYWVKLHLGNHLSHQRKFILHADNTMLFTFDVYLIAINNDVLPLYSLPSSLVNLNLTDNIFPHVPINMLANSEQTLLIKLKTFGPPDVPLVLYSEQAFEERTRLTLLVFGGFISVILLMTVYNFVLYRAIKDKVYLVYNSYLLSVFLVLASVNGYGYLFFSASVQVWLNQHIIFFHYTLVMSLLFFTLFYLRYDLQKNNSYRLGQVLAFALMAMSVFSFFLDQVQQAKIFFSLQPIFYVYVLFIIAQRLKNDVSWARFYFLSWIPLLLGSIVQPLVLLNYVEYSFISKNAFLFGVLVEVTFMSLALAERMRRNEQDRLFDISYHKTTQLPRKSTLENAMTTLIEQGNHEFSVVIIKPEHIECMKKYVDEKDLLALFSLLAKKLSSLFAYNDAFVALTNKNEKICFIDNNFLAVLINHHKNNQSFEIITQSIQQIIGENYQLNELRLPLTAIIGIARYRNCDSSSLQTIARARQVITIAGDRHEKWAHFEQDTYDINNYLLKLAAELQYSLVNNELEIYHQPQIDLKTLRVCGSECLLRWHHKKEGFISPTILIPLAEDLGIINQLTLWVISTSLTQQAKILENEKYNHMVSINISSQDLASQGFLNNVANIIEASEISPDKIIFELTKSLSILRNKQTVTVMESLTSFGITVSIDDFSSGNASMASLDKLPFEELKIDRQFGENIDLDKKRKIMTEATVKMAKALGLEVVAEGINSEEDQNTLRKFGCDIGQGHYYAIAKPLDEYLDWLAVQVNGKIPIHSHGEFIPAEK